MKYLQLHAFWIAVVAVTFIGCKKDDNKIQIVASFTVDKATGDSPLLVEFTNTSTNAVRYNWNFGGGANSTDKNPFYSFTNTSSTSEKNFTVTLTAYASDNSSSTSNMVITVNKNSVLYNPALTYGTMTDQDGNICKTITIGSQTWTAENIRVTHYRNGDSIANVTSNTEWVKLKTGAYCTYENTTNNDDIELYGRLYNYYAVTDSRGISPNGWHLPTDEEWTTLTTYLGGEAVAGGKMRETGNSHWLKSNTSATNESGFTALPSGSRYSVVGTFNDLGNITYWWSSTNYDTAHAWNRYMKNSTSLTRSFDYKNDGYVVRLIKD